MERTLHRSRTLAACLVALALAGSARGQSFNVDIGANGAFPTPPMTYPGAAAQPGFWNPVPGDAAALLIRDLLNITTLVRITAGGGAGNFEFNHAGTAGGDQNLYDDLMNVGPTGAVATWTFTNLQNGLYDVYTYAWAPDSAAARTRIGVDCSADPTIVVGGPWPGAHLFAVTYAAQRVNVTASTLMVRAEAIAMFGSVNGIQLRRLPAVGIPGCFGDGTGEDCPCFNFGALGRGCANSVEAAGAQLSAAGIASVAADTVVLSTTRMPPGASHLYFQGTVALDPDFDGDFGVPFGDGLRCVGGDVIRLGTKTASTCGQSIFGSPADGDVSDLGAVPAAGGTRYYQCWYRNAAPAFCIPGALFNLSNGLQINWAP